MMIEFQCGNLMGYDKDAKRYIECDKRIIVSDEKIGEMVTCPKCKQRVEVPFEPNELQQRKSAKKDRQQDLRQSQIPGGSSKSKAATKQTARSKSSSTKTAKRRGRGTEDDLKLAKPVQRPKSDLATMSFDDEANEERVLPKNKRKRCAQCGEFTDKAGRCRSCGHVEEKFEKATQPLETIPVGLTGFQLWFCETMGEGVSIKLLKYGAHFSLGFIALMLTVLALLGIGGFTGVVIAAIIVGCTALYAGLVIKGEQLASDPHAKLAWFQKPFWNAILYAARAMNWQNYDERYKGRKIIDCRGEGITDDKLRELDDLGLCEVLDLERTPITDQGLRQLYGLPNLHCLVLRKTQVTHEGVFRLQQTHPKLWIWY